MRFEIVVRIAALTGLILSSTVSRGQGSGCKMVSQDDVAALVTLNQATVQTQQMQPNSDECNYEVSSPLGEAGEVELKRFDMGTHAEAVHRMQQDAPFYFEKKPALVNTNDPGDRVYSIISLNGQSVEAVHGQYRVELNVSKAEDGAKAHPSWEYRLQRTALEAAGATILSTPGVAADPVLPKRQAASGSARTSSGGFELPGIFDVMQYLWIIILVPVLFVLYRVFIASRMKVRRLKEVGIPGMARIDGVSDTGVTVNGNPQVKYDVTITPGNGGRPYTSTTKVVVSRLIAPAQQVGQFAPVKIDPKNPLSFIFDTIS